MQGAMPIRPGQCRLTDQQNAYERAEAAKAHAQAMLDAKVEQGLVDLLSSTDNFSSYIHNYEPELGKLLEALRLVPRARQGSKEAKEAILQKLMEFHDELDGEMQELVIRNA